MPLRRTRVNTVHPPPCDIDRSTDRSQASHKKDESSESRKPPAYASRQRRRRPKETLRASPDRSPSELTGTILGFSSSGNGMEMELTTLPALRYGLAHRKGRLKILSYGERK
jgi:hypothetical protein